MAIPQSRKRAQAADMTNNSKSNRKSSPQNIAELDPVEVVDKFMKKWGIIGSSSKNSNNNAKSNSPIICPAVNGLGYHHLGLFYAMLGLSYELIFTSIFDFHFKKHPDAPNKMMGHSSLWCLFIYSTCALFTHKVYFHYLKQSFPRILRIVVYLVITYTWEAGSGFLLRQFDACPWDYRHYPYGLLDGLICLEYAPFWCLAGLLQDFWQEFLHNLRFHKK